MSFISCHYWRGKILEERGPQLQTHLHMGYADTASGPYIHLYYARLCVGSTHQNPPM